MLPMVLLWDALSRSSELYVAWYVPIVIAKNSVVLSTSSLGPVLIPPPPRVPFSRPCSSAALLLFLLVVDVVVCCCLLLRYFGRP